MDISTNDPAPDALTSEDQAREAILHAAVTHRKPEQESEFVEFIENGANNLTPAALQQIVANLQEIRKKTGELNPIDFPHAPAQFGFLTDVVEAFAQKLPPHEEVPYRAVMEAAFALQYLYRNTDLIPDTLGTIGFTDDAAIAAAVITRHAGVFEQLAPKLDRDWKTIYPEAGSSRVG